MKIVTIYILMLTALTHIPIEKCC